MTNSDYYTKQKPVPLTDHEVNIILMALSGVRDSRGGDFENVGRELAKHSSKEWQQVFIEGDPA